MKISILSNWIRAYHYYNMYVLTLSCKFGVLLFWVWGCLGFVSELAREALGDRGADFRSELLAKMLSYQEV